MAGRKKSKRARRAPITIAIHGPGIDIDARIENREGLEDFVGQVAERFAALSRPAPRSAPSVAETLAGIIVDITDEDIASVSDVIAREVARRNATTPADAADTVS